LMIRTYNKQVQRIRYAHPDQNYYFGGRIRTDDCQTELEEVEFAPKIIITTTGGYASSENTR